MCSHSSHEMGIALYYEVSLCVLLVCFIKGITYFVILCPRCTLQGGQIFMKLTFFRVKFCKILQFSHLFIIFSASFAFLSIFLITVW